MAETATTASKGRGRPSNMGASGSDAVAVEDDFVTIEWLEMFGGVGAGADGVHSNNQGASNQLVFRNLLIHDVGSTGMQVQDGDSNADIYNNFVHSNPSRGTIVYATSGTVRVMNNTVYDNGNYGIEALGASTPNVLIQNNIAHSNSPNDFNAAGPNGANSNNLSFDASATAVSPGGGDVPSVSLAAVGFVNDAGPGIDLHLTDTSAAILAATDLSTIFSWDIDGGNRVAPWDIGADEIEATTAVELLSFEAFGVEGAVELRWETGSELDNLGFHLHRSLTEEGPYDQITASVIPGLGSSPEGAQYAYRDSGLVNGTTYYYQLEDIETTGKTEMHGPVAATPAVGATLPEEPDGDGSTPRITYGDPSANGLRVLERSRNGIVLELVTEGFYAIPQEDGSVAIEIPGFEGIGEADRQTVPAIPVKHHWVDAVAGRRVELRSVRGRMEAVTSAWAVSSEHRELVARASGTVKARQHRRRANARAEGLFPAEAARVVTVAFQGESKKALVEMAPVRWSADTGELFLARRLVVRLSFRGVEPSEQNLGGNRGRRRSRKLKTIQGVLARLVTTERGLHGIRYENVFGTRGRLRVDELRLSRQGEDVAFHVEPANGWFRRGSRLYFLGDGADANPYGMEAVYELQLASGEQPGTRMETVDASPWDAQTTFYWKREQQEVNQYFQAALLDASDLWLWDLLLAPVTKSYPIEVTALASTVEAGRLDVWLQGTSDTPAYPDHHVRAYLNGTLVSEVSWNGKAPQHVTADIAPGLLVEGTNALELENVGDTEASYSTVMLDRFSLEYPRQLVGEIEGRFTESGTVTVNAPVHVVETSGSSPRWLYGGASFAVEAGRSYLVVEPSAVKAPELRRPTATSLRSRDNQADYVVIGPRAFVDAAQPLLVHRGEQGLVSQGVAIEDVFAEFGHGESTPEAIRAFLAYAYHEWQSPSPRYVVLLGDGSYDYKDYAQLGGTNPVPPMMVKTSYLWTASDPTLAAVNGDDLLPDLAIGRLPAATVDEVHTIVAKILAWESNAYALNGTAVLVADNPDVAGDFVADAEAAARRIPATTQLVRIYLSELGASETKQSILDAFDNGASLMSYVGHGGIHLWADENVFNTKQLDELSAQEHQPLLLTMNCLNGYFHFPYFGSLAEELVKAENKGVIAAFSPSGLSLNDPARRFHQAMLDELFSGKHLRLGDAVLGAQETYLGTGAFPELLSIYHLFGDPALVLRSTP